MPQEIVGGVCVFAVGAEGKGPAEVIPHCARDGHGALRHEEGAPAQVGDVDGGSRGAVDEQASRRGLLKPVEQAQQAGLAATRSALDDDEAATFNRQIDALEEGLVIAEVQTSSLQVDSHHRTSAAVWFAGTPA